MGHTLSNRRYVHPDFGGAYASTEDAFLPRHFITHLSDLAVRKSLGEHQLRVPERRHFCHLSLLLDFFFFLNPGDGSEALHHIFNLTSDVLSHIDTNKFSTCRIKEGKNHTHTYSWTLGMGIPCLFAGLKPMVLTPPSRTYRLRDIPPKIRVYSSHIDRIWRAEQHGTPNSRILTGRLLERSYALLSPVLAPPPPVSVDQHRPVACCNVIYIFVRIETISTHLCHRLLSHTSSRAHPGLRCIRDSNNNVRSAGVLSTHAIARL